VVGLSDPDPAVQPPPGTTGDATAGQVVTALNKLAMVLRWGAWRQSGRHGLHPTQAQILTLLASRPQGLRLGELAEALGVTSATTSDSVAALLRKGLVGKAPAPGDARAVVVTVTPNGRREAAAIGSWPDAMLAAVGDLDPAEQGALLRVLVKMIRSLQERQAIPAARMCVTCRFFDPYAHPGSERPHHCRFVDAPFGDAELRVDCFDHDPAPADQQDTAWTRFSGQGVSGARAGVNAGDLPVAKGVDE
jgi:DNA-binding MarR family transcriptional regulator